MPAMHEKKSDSSEKRPDRFHTILHGITVGAFTALLLVPLLLLTISGEDKTVLEGEKQYTAPAFSVSDFASADFQHNFENWFSTKYPLRGKLVTAYRQLQFNMSDIGFDISTAFLPKDVQEPALPAETAAPDALDSLDASTAETEAPAPVFTYSDFNPLYADINKRLYERKAVEPGGYKGTDQVIIGKSGYCYENGYINEYMGYSQKYTDCPDAFLQERVDKLTYIQKELERRGIAFTLIITPSKASEYARFIPGWYMAQNTAPEDYVRPVTRLLPLLEEAGVHTLFCADYYDEIGLDETFPITGIHWNKLAAYEACRKLIQMYDEQTGETMRNIIAHSVTESTEQSGFGNPECDIFNIAYSGVSTQKAIRDDLYYWPDVEVEDEENKNKINVLLQSGSFGWDIKHYFQDFRLMRRFHHFYYNTWQGRGDQNPAVQGNEAWDAILKNTNYVIFECNEQYVCMMGTDSPQWGAHDREPLPQNPYDVYQSLYRYLKQTEDKVPTTEEGAS